MCFLVAELNEERKKNNEQSNSTISWNNQWMLIRAQNDAHKNQQQKSNSYMEEWNLNVVKMRISYAFKM